MVQALVGLRLYQKGEVVGSVVGKGEGRGVGRVVGRVVGAAETGEYVKSINRLEVCSFVGQHKVLHTE